jgi:hypothetical protein
MNLVILIFFTTVCFDRSPNEEQHYSKQFLHILHNSTKFNTIHDNLK